ncbi:hypothetical protein FACS189447_09470 [Spirochaetia bacterium]|nr:hypothetical protein FACS189447_09470 [Spirochaetia bacterium]
MIGNGKTICCQNIGELKNAIKDLPDSIRFTTMSDEDRIYLKFWKLTKDSDPLSYDDEKSMAADENRKPNFKRIEISEDET